MIARVAAALVAAAAVAASAAQPVAFVADLQGNASIEGKGRLNFLAELPAGIRLLLGTGATVTVTYAATGAEFTLQGPGEFVVTPTAVKADRGAPPRKRTVSVLPDPAVISTVSRTANASLRMRGITRRPSSAIALDYPVNTRVMTLQPTLRWSGEPTADRFEVSISDSAGKEVWKGNVKTPMARPEIKLSPSTAYAWTVMTPNGVRADGRFETVSAAAMAKAEKSRAAATTFGERVVHAFILQDIGATQDAKEAWAALARERPDLPELSALAH